MSRRTDRDGRELQELAQKVQRRLRLATALRDPKVRERLAACDRQQFDPAYRLARLDLVASR
jgi:hypothetical protein